jgi:hypothetical protein
VSLLEAMYQRYTLEFHRVVRQAGGALTFETYDRPHPAPADPMLDSPTTGLVVRPAAAF